MENIIELIVDKDLILFLEEMLTKYLIPIPAEDPLGWVDTKSYKDRLKSARKKTNQNSAVMIAKGRINGIEVTAGAINLSLLVVLLEQQKVKQLFMVFNTLLITKHHLFSFLVVEDKECLSLL